MKNVSFPLCLLIILLSACSDSDDPYKRFALKLNSSVYQIEPLQDIPVYINLDRDVMFATYDSICWHANGQAHRYMGDDFNGIILTDYKLGKHKAYLFGYKDGAVLSKDSIEYEVVPPTGDFIHIKWGKQTRNQYYAYITGMTPEIEIPKGTWEYAHGGVRLKLSHNVELTKKEYATFDLLPWASYSSFKYMTRAIPDINDFDWHKNIDIEDLEDTARYDMEYAFFHNYLKEFYGDPILTYDGEDITQTTLWEEYSERFNYTPWSDYYPVEIWSTPTTFICLIRGNNRIGGVNQKGICLVVAEPRK